MKYIIEVDNETEIISVMSVIINSIAQKQANLLKLDIEPLVDFQKNEITNLKSFLKSLKKIKSI